MALEAADPDQQVEHAGQAGAGGDVADTPLVEGDGPGIPAPDQRQRPGLDGEADHLQDVGDQEVAESPLQVKLGFPGRIFVIEPIHGPRSRLGAHVMHRVSLLGINRGSPITHREGWAIPPRVRRTA
jgi:hypothetical protein